MGKECCFRLSRRLWKARVDSATRAQGRELYRYRSDQIRQVRPKFPLPFDKIKLFFPEPLICILLTCTITKLAAALGLVCTKCTVPLGTWIFGNFKQEFLLNGKRAKYLIWRQVGPARWLTLPLQKGDSASWVTLLAEPTFCYLY